MCIVIRKEYLGLAEITGSLTEFRANSIEEAHELMRNLVAIDSIRVYLKEKARESPVLVDGFGNGAGICVGFADKHYRRFHYIYAVVDDEDSD